MMKRSFISAVLLLSFMMASDAFSQVPRIISYQGALVDQSGGPVSDGNRSITMNIYDAPTGGAPLYTETQTVKFFRGVFNVGIGSKTPFPATLAFDRPYYLGISIDNGQELTPRTQITAGAYAMHSAVADVAQALSPSAGGVVTMVNGQSGALQVTGTGNTTVSQAGNTITINSDGVSSINGVTGSVDFVGLGATTVTHNGNRFTISSTGGIQEVAPLDPSISVKNGTSALVQVAVSDLGITTGKIADQAVTAAKLADGAVTDSKISGGISYSKLTGVPASLPPSGAAGGDLAGTYPNPTIAAGAVTTAKIADGSVNDAKIASGISYSKLNGAPTSLPPNGAAGGDLTGTYPNPTVAAGAITTAKIADGSVTTAKIADGSVVGSKIANGVVLTNHLADGSVTDVKIAGGISYSKITGGPTTLPPSGAAGGDLAGTYPNPTIAPAVITTAKLADGSVMTPKLADSSVISTKIGPAAVRTVNIFDGSVTTVKINDSSVVGSKIGTAAVATAHIADGAVTTAKLPDGAVTSAKIADGAIVDADVSPTAAVAYSKLNLTNSIQNSDIVANAITTSKVANGTVTTSKMADSAISGLKLLTNAVNTAHIADGAVTTAKVNSTGATTGNVLTYNGTSVAWLPPAAGGPAGGDLSGTYPNPVIAAGAVTSAKIADGTIVDADVSPTAAIAYSKLNLTNSIQNGDITANAITTSKVANGTVTTSKMADSAISGLKLLTNAVNTAHIANGAVTLPKVSSTGAIANQAIVFDGTNVVWGSAVPGGTAGGDLSGTYPNPVIAAGAVTSAKIADGTIVDADVSPTAAIAYSKLNLTNSIQNSDIVANAITTSKVANGTVTTSKMADSAISGLKLLT
ncbi:MAG TPA: hypothetical protein VHI13_18830, partial [Candidatus Kapabacteria bacterium]|nr:hypothetical protein [Candidatus Kapabacteria bacterium]